MFNYDKLDFEDKTMEYLEKINELGRNISKFEQIPFSDGYLMYSWYMMQKEKISKERKNNIIPDENRMKEIMLFAKIEDTIYELKKQKYIQKVNQYINKINELGTNIKREDKFLFDDGTSMYAWYLAECRKLVDERKKDLIPSNERLREIIEFAQIEDLLFEIKRGEKLKLYEQRVLEYINIVRQINRQITRKDNLLFTDYFSMYAWYANENKKLNLEREKNIIPTKYRLQEIMLFAQIEDELYNSKKEKSNRKNKKINQPFDFEKLEKQRSYIKQLEKLRKDNKE